MKKISYLFIFIFSFLFLKFNVFAGSFISFPNDSLINFFDSSKVSSFINFINTDSHYKDKNFIYFYVGESSSHTLASCSTSKVTSYQTSISCSSDFHYISYNSDTNTFGYTFDSLSWKSSLLYSSVVYNSDLVYRSSYNDEILYSSDNIFSLSSYLSTKIYNDDNYFILFKSGDIVLSFLDLYYPDLVGCTSSYTINYYFDDILDDSKTIHYNSLTGLVISNFDLYSDNIYKLRESYNFIVRADSDNIFNVFYDSSISYTINYYFDNVLDVSKSSNRVGRLNEKVNFTDFTDDFYYLDNSISYDFYLSLNNNVFNIFFKSKVYVPYVINYYFDGILDDSKTYRDKSLIGTEITDFVDYSDDKFHLLEDMDFSLTIDENESLNVLSIFYYSDLYGTDKQTIDTSSSDFYLFFNFNDIKDMFPSINFDNFTQFQQLVITIIFNILFVVIILFFIYIFIKILYKVISLII